MFRMEGVPQIDYEEERRKIKEDVRANLITFFAWCAFCRIAPRLIEKFY